MSAKTLTRRLFMKAVPAAPLAASSLAADVASGALNPQPSAGYAMGGINPAHVDTYWAAERRSKLERFLSGNLTEDEQIERRREDYRSIAYHYDSLRSLSPVMRSKFHMDQVRARENEQERSWAMLELRRLLSQ